MSSAQRRSRRARVLAAAGSVGLVAAVVGAYVGRYDLHEEWLKAQWSDKHFNAAVMEKALMIAGGNPAEAQNESKEAFTIASEFEQARTAPSGIVAPGAYSTAYTAITGLQHSTGTWHEVTKVPYNADDPRYRDWNSNSSGGAGHVTGRITGLAADGSYVYAAGADGGVWRTDKGGAADGKAGWTPIADALPSLSSGDLQLDSLGHLWFATGEANTGGTSYVGSGVYRLDSPKSGSFTAADRVGGTELESTTIGRIRTGTGVVFAATNRGVWWRPDSAAKSTPWTFGFAPNPAYLPGGASCTDNVSCGATNAAYKNIVNDIAVDPKNPKHVIAALGWRSGDTYNGFYETADYTKGPSSWHKLSVTLGGITNKADVGYTTFAFSKDGGKLYAMVQQPSKINGASNLAGIYLSKTGSPLGPWNQIANHTQLLQSGSALDKKGYSVGVQAWYNQFLTVDPANANHVWAGLEEVFETKDAGSHWSAVSPYWNFTFPCWSIYDTPQNGQPGNTCPLAGHPDQHSVAVGGGNVYFGNDGGVYRRPVNGTVNANGNATDLVSMSTDGTLGALQYYSVSVGKDTTSGNGGMVVSGGLQDNGVSNLFSVKTDATNADTGMGSNFGGDGGDGAADPNNGCNQLQEYVNLAVKVTNNCALNPGALTEADSKSWSIDPGDPSPRFIAPVDLDASKSDTAIMGGRYVYTVPNVWQARSASAVKTAFDQGAGRSTTAVAMTNGTAYASWCGPCGNVGFARGVATNAGGSWHQLALDGVPNRFIAGVGVDKANGNHAFLAVNGFSRRFSEGPGVGIGHVYETTDGGATWTDISANLPDVPASTVKLLPSGALVVGTDLGAFVRPAGATDWKVLGTGLPLTVVMDIEQGPDGNVYAATHGRGIWSITP